MILGTGVKNHNEFFTDLYLTEAIKQDLRPVINSWSEMKSKGEIEKTRWELLRSFRNRFLSLKEKTGKYNDHGHIRDQQNLIADIIRTAGYAYERTTYTCDQEMEVPILGRVNKPDGAPEVLILEALYCPEINPQDIGLLTYTVLPEQYPKEFPEERRFPSELSYDEMITKYIFSDAEPPRWIVVIGAEAILLIDRSKWPEKRMLEFDLTEIYDSKSDELFKLVAVLTSREQLSPTHGENLLDTMNENSHQHAYEVSEDLKYAVRECVEILGNEVLFQYRAKGLSPLPSAEDLSVQALRWMYRLLFLFYIEARPELEYIPLDNELYMKGYSLESLREITDGPEPDADAEGTFLHESLRILFTFVQRGINLEDRNKDGEDESIQELFSIDSLQSHLFDPKSTQYIEKITLRNGALFKIIQNLSLTKVRGNRRRGRVSYSHLGINQLGSVYEGLLSYRGFYAEKDLYEVKKKGDEENPLNQAFFVTYEELQDYSDEERVYQEDGTFKKYPAGTYIYRLAGRDRQKSASYYTPHVLTECLVKYTLKELLENIETDEILNLTICEPAMGSAAFINEAIDQLSEAYLSRKQKESGIVIPQDEYITEKQKVKMHIADHNVYGVDLNPIAVELAEVSLWLNTIYKGAHVPWFSLQLKCGNSLIGARRQFFYRSQVIAKKENSYLQEVPKRFEWQGRAAKNRIYHFLLPDANMASYQNKVIKDLEPEKINKIEQWRKSFATPLTEAEADKLVEISKSVDLLWTIWSDKLKKLRIELTDEVSIFGREAKESFVGLQYKDNAYRKELSSESQKNSSEYQRLKLAMDYWCSLWFWPIEKADQLPSRSQFIQDMEEILIGKRTHLPVGSGQLSFIDIAEIAPLQGILSETGLVNLNQLEEHHPHLHTVQEIAKNHRFHHWELEYADIFQNRGGFDLILGNPPWLKVEWEEKGVLSDYDPKYTIKEYDAKKTAESRLYTLLDLKSKTAYIQECCYSFSTKYFLNATQNYPLLKGMQTNLYKCFISLFLYIGTNNNYTGFIHPDGVYNDKKGSLLRSIIYPRLKYHFHFTNELILFAIAHNKQFGMSIYGPSKSNISFLSISNLFYPKTIEESFNYVGNSQVEGIKINGKWNMSGHKDRIIKISQNELRLFFELNDGGTGNIYGARLSNIHARQLVSVLKKLAEYPNKLGDLKGKYFTSEMWHETNAKNEGLIKRDTNFPLNSAQWILSGPHIYLGNPFYKTPRKHCRLSSDYDNIDLTNIPSNYLPRTNFLPVSTSTIDKNQDSYYLKLPEIKFAEKSIKFNDDYRLIHRRRLSLQMERTFLPAIVPPCTAHIHGCISTRILDLKTLISFTGYCISIIADFFIKITNKEDLYESTLKNFPLLETNNEIHSRVLLLNCLTENFRQLWEIGWKPLSNFKWTKNDQRLDNIKIQSLSPTWTWNVPLRTDFERYQALLEIDVLISQELGLTLEELLAIYRIHFNIMRNYEKQTFYDQKGRIVFTVNRGLTGVGFPRKGNRRQGTIGWEDICDMSSGTVSRTIIDDTLPRGPVEREIVYYAPFDRCDREADYATAWAEFERRKSL